VRITGACTVADAKELRRLRGAAWGAMLTRLRAEHLAEHGQLLAKYSPAHNATISASTDLRRAHRARAAELYREEVLARGLPDPKPRPGRWPKEASDG
jgi:hypothetical protein